MKDAAATDKSAPPRHTCVCDCEQCELHGCGMFGPQPDGTPGVRVVPAPKRVRKQLRRQLVTNLMVVRAAAAGGGDVRERIQENAHGNG